MLTWIILVLFIVLFVIYKIKTLASPTGVAKGLPYRKKDYLLTKAERSFYGALLNAAKDQRVVVFAKVRLGDLLYLPKGTENRASYWNKIQSKHIDFLICDQDNVKPLLAVELNDSSHERADRAERDAFLFNALKSADLPLMQITAQHTYNVSELSARIKEALI